MTAIASWEYVLAVINTSTVNKLAMAKLEYVRVLVIVYI